MVLPQLSSRSSVQFQMRRKVVAFGSVNHLSSGVLIRGESTRPMKRMWDLDYRGLLDGEVAELYGFCNSREATIDGFVFLDPFSNLLACSEDLTTADWISSALASVTAVSGGSDDSQVHIIENAAGVEQSVRQETSLTGDGTFCASCFVRSDLPGSGALGLFNGTADHVVGIQSGTEWSQVYVSADLSIEVAPLVLALVVAPGCTLQVKGMQLEHQPFPSRYKPTWGSGGIYADARVVYESYQVVQHGPSWFDCSFRIEA